MSNYNDTINQIVKKYFNGNQTSFVNWYAAINDDKRYIMLPKAALKVYKNNISNWKQDAYEERQIPSADVDEEQIHQHIIRTDHKIAKVNKQNYESVLKMAPSDWLYLAFRGPSAKDDLHPYRITKRDVKEITQHLKNSTAISRHADVESATSALPL